MKKERGLYKRLDHGIYPGAGGDCLSEEPYRKNLSVVHICTMEQKPIAV